MPSSTFLGISVSGEINQSHKRVAQRSLDDLAPLMQALLDDLTIESFSWGQYTPYFNDGEPCVFSVDERLQVHVVTGDGSAPRLCGECGNTVASEFRYCGKCGNHVPLNEDEDDDDSDEGVEYNTALGKRKSQWDDREKHYVNLPYTGPDEARYDRCLALEKALGSGEFDDVLLDAFGDHAVVSVSRAGITVRHYEHD